jgi:photosystem II stability/assembly factor-like uncharacterized protein
MSKNPNNKSTNSQSIFRHACLTKVVSVFLALFFLFFTVTGVIYAQQQGIVEQDLFSVSFPNNHQGWACGRWGTVLHTEDGGKSWVHQGSGTDYTLTSITFTDTQNGWAVGDGGTIIHTEDGGKSWMKQKCPVDYYLMGACFVNDQQGWAVTEWTTILHTEDGGKNWEVQFRGAEDYILKSVSFCDPLNGWAVGEYGYTYHTSDGGLTWEHQAGSFALSEEVFELVGENTLFNAFAVDPMTAWAVGIDGYVTKTIDGGATWQKVTANVPKTQLFGIATDGKGTVIIGGSGLLIVSSDGGRSFCDPKINPPVKYGWMYGIAQRGTEGFVAVGSESWIYLSGNKGGSWLRSETGTGM